MKVKLLALLALAFLVISCKEDDPEPTAAEKQAVLLAGNKGQSKTWIISSFEVDGDSFYPPSLSCFFDNEYEFSNNANQTFEGTEGEVNCFVDPDDDGVFDVELPDEIESGQWAFSLDGKSLFVLSNDYNSQVAVFSYFGPNSTPFPAEVVTLTKELLELEMPYVYEGNSGVITVSFEAK
jgi:hypothetical protein